MKKSGLCVVLILFVMNEGFSQISTFPRLSANKIWTSKNHFDTPESVIFDETRKIIYVSNISGEPREKNGSGFISKLSSNGIIEELKWVDGLHAPKGMCIYNNSLYVTDINEVVEISLEEGKIINRYKSKEAEFLNDITVTEGGTIYVSDNVITKIFTIDKFKLVVWINNKEMSLPNGLYAAKDELLIGNDGYILSVNYKTKETEKIISNTGFIDGLEKYSDGVFIISDFSGKVQLVDLKNGRKVLFDTSLNEIMAADIDYVMSEQLLLVPTFYNNSIVAYIISQK